MKSSIILSVLCSFLLFSLMPVLAQTPTAHPTGIKSGPASDSSQQKAVPSWHPAKNTMKRIDGPGKDLGAVLTGGGNEWAVVDAWTCAFAGLNIYGFASQGGHKQSADSGTYALEDFMQNHPPDWEVVVPAASKVPEYVCSLIDRLVPSPSHGYNTV
ncbi:MAG: hypothetical protein ACYTG7_24195, partial [Planctomycetota bacterium]